MCPVFCTGVEVFIGSKVQCLFCVETCSTEGRGGEKGGSANSKIKHTEPLTQEIPQPVNFDTGRDILHVLDYALA